MVALWISGLNDHFQFRNDFILLAGFIEKTARACIFQYIYQWLNNKIEVVPNNRKSA